MVNHDPSPFESGPYLLPVPGGLVQRLQPHVAQRQHGVRVVLRGRLLQDALKLLLARPPLLLGQVEVPDEGPGVRVVLWSKGTSPITAAAAAVRRTKNRRAYLVTSHLEI